MIVVGIYFFGVLGVYRESRGVRERLLEVMVRVGLLERIGRKNFGSGRERRGGMCFVCKEFVIYFVVCD